MTLNDRAMHDLTQQSQDLQSDALKKTASGLDELTEVYRDPAGRPEADPAEAVRSAAAQRDGVHTALLGGGAVAATAFGAALLSLISSPAFAASSPDVQMLQTSASVENLAVATYRTALTLPYIGGSSANQVIKAFAQTTMGQHRHHADAFNAAAKALGGKRQTKPDPKYLPVVKAAVAKISKQSPSAGALAVVDLAMTLENVAAQTYVKQCAAYSQASAKRIVASIMGVEAQHVAILTAVQALLKAGAPQLIALSPKVAKSLPAAAGSLGFPHAFYSTTMASPAKEGAVS